MRAAFEIALNEPGPERVDELRNFGEDVFRALRGVCDEGLIDEVDRATHSFVVRGIRRQDIGTAAAGIGQVIRRYGWENQVSIRRVDELPAG